MYFHYSGYSDSSREDPDSTKVISFLFLYLGSTVFAEIQGVIDACIKLSGMPDLSLSFMVSFDLFYNPCMHNTFEMLNAMIIAEIKLVYKILLVLYLCVFDLACICQGRRVEIRGQLPGCGS